VSTITETLLKPLDVVELVREVDEIKAGSIGTVLEVLPAHGMYIVEIVREDGSHEAIIDAPADSVRAI
jgi:Domain of unknown function (DUF4926)